jgi:transposase-like protein
MAQSADASKERVWLELVRRWQQSELSVRAFCQRHRLSEPSFYAWRRALRQRGLLDEAAAAVPAFVSVAVATPVAPTPVLEVVLESGRRLRVTVGFDAELLRQVLRVLEEPAC